jgi:hypothetical protein
MRGPNGIRPGEGGSGLRLDLRGDIKEAKAAIEKLGESSKWVSVNVAKGSGVAMKRWIEKRMGNYLSGKQKGRAITGKHGFALKAHDTGRGLFGSIYFKARQQGGVVTTALGYYGEPLEKGWSFTPPRGFAKFIGRDGKWKTVHQINIPAKHWFTRSAEGFEGSPEEKKAIDAPLAAAIKKAGLE